MLAILDFLLGIGWIGALLVFVHLSQIGTKIIIIHVYLDILHMKLAWMFIAGRMGDLQKFLFEGIEVLGKPIGLQRNIDSFLKPFLLGGHPGRATVGMADLGLDTA